ncbi:MAG: DUF3047 domain-containing protein [Deltaproteobacteria bacterium]|nr:DUF3047 domain-containing protein [Deltaproteobacteria bacterium]
MRGRIAVSEANLPAGRIYSDRAPRLVVAGLLAVAFGTLPGRALAQSVGSGVLLREDFRDLARWRRVVFSGRAHTRYRVVASASGSQLETRSEASASGLRWIGSYDVHAHQKLRWRWKVGNVYRRGDATRKSGDDYPLRVYVVFAYDADTAGRRRPATERDLGDYERRR